jgi:hypothetical protein
MLVCVALFGALSLSTASAAPILTVTPDGLTAGNRNWLVDISPDPSLFSGSPPGGSLAAELAFAFDAPTTLLSVVVADPVAWPNPNPGNNPYTGTVTVGTYVDLVNSRTFDAYGSSFFTSSAPTHFLKITTAGSGPATLRYGVATSGNLSKGARIAQAGQNFDGYTGVVSLVPEPATCTMAFVGAAGVLLARRRRRVS